MNTTVLIGHLINFSIEYVDANGNPPPAGTPNPTPDSPPVWTNTPASPPVDTFVASADGTTAQLTATAAGSDTVVLAVTVGGVNFTATDLVTISAAPFVVAGVQIVADVQ